MINWTKYLSEKFSSIVSDWLTDDQMKLVNLRNFENQYDERSCASHDFIDSNQAMLDAMESLRIQVDIFSDEQAALINEAWQMSKKNHFEPSRRGELISKD